MAKPYQTLARLWAGQARIKAVGASEAEVRTLEERYDLRLPEDFREYLLCAAPKYPLEDDECFASWRSIDRIKNIPDEYEHPISLPTVAEHAERYLFFADYAIWAMAWVINCGEDAHRGRVAVISGPDRFVANSFAEFVDQYEVDVRTLT